MEYLITDNVLTLIEVLIVVYRLIGIVMFLLLAYVTIECIKTVIEYLKYTL